METNGMKILIVKNLLDDDLTSLNIIYLKQKKKLLGKIHLAIISGGCVRKVV